MHQYVSARHCGSVATNIILAPAAINEAMKVATSRWRAICRLQRSAAHGTWGLRDSEPYHGDEEDDERARRRGLVHPPHPELGPLEDVVVVSPLLGLAGEVPHGPYEVVETLF